MRDNLISKQLLRSSTSIGANIVEALDAYSKKDFVFKMSLAIKEARESYYWIMLLDKSSITKTNMEKYINDIQQIIRILTSIVKTTKENLEKNQ